MQQRRARSASRSTSSVVRVDELQLVGDDTQLDASAARSTCSDERIALRATGDANLGILQGFFRDVRSSGRAELTAAIDGPLDEPVFSGSATIADGRLRHFSLPHSLDAHQRHDPVRRPRHPPRRRDGDAGRRRVQFGGRIGVRRLSARRAQRHRARRGHAPAVPGRLPLDGRRRPRRCAATFKAPTLGGTVTRQERALEPARRSERRHPRLRRGRATAADVGAGAGAGAVPLRFDVEAARAVDAAHREQPGAPGRERRPAAARHLRSAAALRPRRSRPRRGHLRGPALLVTRGTSTSPTRRGSSRSSTSRPRRASACRARPIASPCAPPARSTGCSRSSARIRRCRRPTCSRCSSATSGARRTRRRRAARAAEPERRAQTRHPDDARDAAAGQPGLGRGRPRRRADLRRRHVPAHAVAHRSVQPVDARLNPSARVTIGKRISDRVYLTFSRSLEHARSTIRSSCSSTTRAIGCRGSCRGTRTATYALEVRVRHAF